MLYNILKNCRRFSTLTKQYDKCIYNINKLIENEKHSYAIYHIKDQLENINNNTDLNIIENNINKIFLSYSIQEAIYILKNKKHNDSKIYYYQIQYQRSYYNNNELEYLFRQIENEIKLQNPTRNVYNLLPFYYNVYLQAK